MPFIIHPSIVAIYPVVFSYAAISIPFIASGIVISLALTRFPARVSQLYAADLSAAALSVCASVLAVVIALWWSISAAFWAGCAAYLIALVAFARAARAERSEPRRSRGPDPYSNSLDAGIQTTGSN